MINIVFQQGDLNPLLLDLTNFFDGTNELRITHQSIQIPAIRIIARDFIAFIVLIRFYIFSPLYYVV
jgi:hypothetical protein